MMDVLLRLISCVEPASLRQKTLHVCPPLHTHIYTLTDPHAHKQSNICASHQQWLNEEKLAQRLIELIHPERDEEVRIHTDYLNISYNYNN